jgi:hypothetical protein
MDTKVCNKCQVEKPITEFYARNKSKGHLGLKYMCKTCENEKGRLKYHAEYKHEPAHYKKQYVRKIQKQYGITEEEYTLLWENTKGVCKICNATMESALFKNTRGVRAVVDHCHKTGDIRGIICHKCNGGLGQFDDDLENLKRAVQYLEESKI